MGWKQRRASLSFIPLSLPNMARGAHSCSLYWYFHDYKGAIPKEESSLGSQEDSFQLQCDNVYIHKL